MRIVARPSWRTPSLLIIIGACLGACLELRAPAWAQSAGISGGAKPSAPQIGRMACSDIVAEVDSRRLRNPKWQVSVAAVGRQLGQDPLWVERCMRLYGRRPSRPAAVNPETREEHEERWESGEVEEVAPEDMRDTHVSKPEQEHEPKLRPPPKSDSDEP
jgi:hypothetical protein